jgi:hypothetical protein
MPNTHVWQRQNISRQRESKQLRWAANRHQIARTVVDMTDRTRAATLKPRLLRNAMLEIIGHIPGVSGRIARLLAELGNR